MDYQEKSKIVNRILARKFYGSVKYRFDYVDVEFRDPTSEILTKANWIYDKTLEEFSSEEILSDSDLIDVLRKCDRWNDGLEVEFNSLTKGRDSLLSLIPTLKFQKSKLKLTKDALEKTNKRIAELNQIKNQFSLYTIEFLAETAKRRYIVTNTTFPLDNNNIKLWKTDDFLQTLVVYYYKESTLSEKVLRQLARTEPWRIYWTTSKTTATPLFSHSCSDMTQLQSILITYSKMYDFAYESPNRPSDDVIDNDEEFDAWYKGEIDRIEGENAASQNNSFSSKSGKIGLSQEVFIPADREGAKEVYKMNNQIARSVIKGRETVIENNGAVNEGELPDIKNSLKMEYNKIASERRTHGT